MRNALLVAAGLLLVVAGCSRTDQPVDYREATIAELQSAMQRGETSAEQLTLWYLDRYRAIDQAGPTLRSIIEINPDALTHARALDEERQRSGARGPLHGIPVLLKANIDTADRMHTTAGSLALADHRANADAFLVAQLRDAGAVILGKTNLSEWANIRSEQSSSGWSSVGGQTLNPYDRTRSPCGSSSGSGAAVAANLAVAAVGTETNGSIVCPSGSNGIVGIKPTLGLVSRSGIIPIAHSFDTAGPMARTVHDAATLLTGMLGIDAADTAMIGAELHADYSADLDTNALRGKRIGVVRGWYGEGSDADVDAIFSASVDALRRAGAVIVDPVRFDVDSAMYDAGYLVMQYELKAGLRRYFAQSGALLESLAEVIAFNEANRAATMPIFGQDIFEKSVARGPLDDAEYRDALAASRNYARRAIDAQLVAHNLDALVAPTNGPAWPIDHENGDPSGGVGSSSLAAYAGYPNVTVPAGFARGLPVGVSFFGAAYSEKQLIAIAYAFEQTTGVRKAPGL